MTNRKREIVEKLMPCIPLEYQQSIDHAVKTWWVNFRSDGGLRLTDAGYEMLNDVLKLESWSFDFDRNTKPVLNKKMILDMDHKIKWPYYIDINPRKKQFRVIFFSSREAMMASMYGDLQRWLASL